MGCDFCTDPAGDDCFPMYGAAPHIHVGERYIGSTRLLPRSEWPDNFEEDPDCKGLGTYWCPKCGHGKPPKGVEVRAILAGCQTDKSNREASFGQIDMSEVGDI
jgi:hypothetical protein